jgi:hypothetical protein
LCDVRAENVPSDLSDAIALAIVGLHQAGMNALLDRGRR